MVSLIPLYKVPHQPSSNGFLANHLNLFIADADFSIIPSASTSRTSSQRISFINNVVNLKHSLGRKA